MKIVNKNFPSNNSYFSKGNLYVYNFFFQGLSKDENFEITISFSFIFNKNYEENHKFTLDDFIELSPTQENTNFMNGIFLSKDSPKTFFYPVLMHIDENGMFIYLINTTTGLLTLSYLDIEGITLVSKQIL